jgi:hypothetical protein
VRYAFHGKVRATGQVVDGFVEASSSSEAIDRLADQGIIGVHTVRPDPLPPRNSILLAGQESGQPVPQLESAVGAPEIVLTSLVDKLTKLVGQVENLLSRPMQAMPQRGGAKAKSRSDKNNSDAQNTVLAAIFETNMDLRKSLVKLADVTATLAAPAQAAAATKPDEGNGAPLALAQRDIANHDDASDRDSSSLNHSIGAGNNGHSRDLSAHPTAPRDVPDLKIAAQSVA